MLKHAGYRELNSDLQERLKYSIICPDNKILLILKQDLTTTRIEHPSFCGKSRSLYLGNNKLLLTGGKNTTFTCEIDLMTNAVCERPHLKHGRVMHAMIFLDNKPAVIAGSELNSTAKLTSVEVLEDEWKEVGPINIARVSFSAVNAYNMTYILGGEGADAEPMNSIERYSEKKWEVLSVLLPLKLSDLGAVVTMDERILILGGYMEFNTYSDMVFEWDEHHEVILERLKCKTYFPFNSWLYKDNTISSFDNNTEIVSYRTTAAIRYC